MLKNKYEHKLALGSIAAGGGLATLIPPSVVFIVYGMTAGCSVGELFLAGVMPGLILAAMFIFYIVWRCWRHPEAAPLVTEEVRNMPLRERRPPCRSKSRFITSHTTNMIAPSLWGPRSCGCARRRTVARASPAIR